MTWFEHTMNKLATRKNIRTDPIVSAHRTRLERAENVYRRDYPPRLAHGKKRRRCVSMEQQLSALTIADGDDGWESLPDEAK